MAKLSPLSPARWPWAALLASAFMLAAAHTFEAIGYPPCSLCLRQREVYWAIIAASAIALIVNRLRYSEKTAPPFVLLIGLAFLWGAGVAAYHAGVEWKFWPGPETCTGGGGRLRDLSKALEGPQIVVMCDEAAWRVLGISMPGYNALISFGLAVLSFVSVRAP
jgi:disulfide bond formation protein DsbB